MRLLADWVIWHGNAQRKIELLQGDLARLPAEHAVDILVVSAFRNDFVPTSTSLIGALYRQGLSIEDLASDKQVDLRQQYSCWLSKPIDSGFNFRQIVCIESGWRGSPPEITDDLFGALAPYLLTDFANARVAMPLIGTGDQGYSRSDMLRAILTAAVSWIERGLRLSVLKLVIHDEQSASTLTNVFMEYKAGYSPRYRENMSELNAQSRSNVYDVFISYSHKNADAATTVIESLRSCKPDIKIFYDRFAIGAGYSWLMTIADALDNSKRVIAIYSPDYWNSKNCKLEFSAAFARQNDIDQQILYPIYILQANIPYMFKNLQYLDCRVNDGIRIAQACSQLARELA